jgi:purine-binding chemotaxis protein CheW
VSEDRPEVPQEAARDLLAFADWVSETSAQPSAPGLADPERLYLAFDLDGEAYGVPVERVLEVLRVEEIQRVPRAPAHVRGVTNVRGAILPVVEVRTRIGLAPLALTPAARIVRLEVGGRSLGLLVDRVTGLQKVLASQVEPAAGVVAGWSACLSGMAQGPFGLLALLDPDEIVKAAGG